MAKKYDICAVTGEYEKDGQTKKRYMNVGAVLENENGPYIVLEKWFNPAGVDSPFLSLFEPKMKESGYSAAKAAVDSFEDDSNIPF